VQVQDRSVTLQWQRRLYDTRGNAHPNARSQHNVRQKRRLDTQRHCCSVNVAHWAQLHGHIERRESIELCRLVARIADMARLSQQGRREHLEVSLAHRATLSFCLNFIIN